MKKETPDVVPQSVACRVLEKSRNYAHVLISRGHIKPVIVYGERWVSLKALREFVDGKK